MLRQFPGVFNELTTYCFTRVSAALAESLTSDESSPSAASSAGMAVAADGPKSPSDKAAIERTFEFASVRLVASRVTHSE